MPKHVPVLLPNEISAEEKARNLENWIKSVPTSSPVCVSHVKVKMGDNSADVVLTKPALLLEGKPEVVHAPGSDGGYSDDFEPEPVVLRKESKTVRVYRRSCNKLGIIPLRKVLRQFGSMDLCFRDYSLSKKELKALCMALLYERHTWNLDLSGNRIERKELEYVICVLEKRPNIKALNLTNNDLAGSGMRHLADFLRRCETITDVDISGNKLTDKDGAAIADIIQDNHSIIRLRLAHNELRESGGKIIGAVLVKNTHLQELDLSWNHLRQKGAISIAKGLETNRHLQTVNLAWNGFGYEGSVALGDMLMKNSTMTSLDISSNRISAAALLEILRGLSKNRSLNSLRIGQNPITASFTSVLLEAVHKNQHLPLQYLNLEGIVVDKEFEGILEKIKATRYIEVTYEISLPISKRSPEEMMKEIHRPQAFNIDPLRMLYLLKEKNRARDFFEKINKDKDDGLTRDELFMLFKESGVPCSQNVVDRIMEFMDTNGDGTIDLAEFLAGDKKIKKYSREQVRNAMAQQDENYAKYSRTFRKANLDPLTLTLKVQEPSITKQLSPNTLPLPSPGVPGSRRGSLLNLPSPGLPRSRRGSVASVRGN